MSDDIGVREYIKGDEEKIVALLEHVFNGWPQFDLSCESIDHWHWKFRDNPLKFSAVSVAEHEGKIVGCSHGYYLKVKIGQSSLLGQQGCDLAVHEDFRGRGLHDRLSKQKEIAHVRNKVNITYSLSGNPIVIRRDKEHNRPEFPYPIQAMFSINDINKHFKEKPSEYDMIKKYGYKTLRNWSKFKNQALLKESFKQDYDFKVLETNIIDDKFELFWREIKDHYNFIVERDLSYLRWRYCDPRGGNYSFRYIAEGGTVLGYSVLRINKHNINYPEGYLVDLLVLPERLDVIHALIQDANKYFSTNNVNIFRAFVLQGHPYQSILIKNGYIKERQKLHLFYTPKNLGEEWREVKVSPVEKIHFMYGDLDWI